MSFLIVPRADHLEEDILTNFQRIMNNAFETEESFHAKGVLRKNYIYLASVVAQVVITIFAFVSQIYIPGAILGAIVIVQIKTYRDCKAVLITHYNNSQKAVSEIYDKLIAHLQERWKAKTDYMIKTFNEKRMDKGPTSHLNETALEDFGNSYDAKHTIAENSDETFFEHIAKIYAQKQKTQPKEFVEWCKKAAFGADTQKHSSSTHREAIEKRNGGYVHIKIEKISGVDRPLACIEDAKKE